MQIYDPGSHDATIPELFLPIILIHKLGPHRP